MQIFITVLMVLLMLGILIGCHELGHLLVAKAFNVYCLEYSIGFGPKLFSIKRKKSETAFSLRALPLGGYVSMYGEGVELPPGVQVPIERSLNGTTAGKRAWILSAGVIVNFLLSLIFTFIFAFCFKVKVTYSFQRVYSGYDYDGNVLVYEEGNKDTYGMQTVSMWARWYKAETVEGWFKSSEQRIYAAEYVDEEDNTFYIVDPKGSIERNGSHYDVVITYFPNTGAATFDIMGCLSYYAPQPSFVPSEGQKKMHLDRVPNKANPFVLQSGDIIHFNPRIIGIDPETGRPMREQLDSSKTMLEYREATLSDENPDKHKVIEAVVKDDLTIAKSGLIITYLSEEYWPSFKDRMRNFLGNYSNFFISLGKGLAQIFTFNFKNLGSVVAIGSIMSQASTQIGWAQTFFFYGGYISLNLAIFNLFPFPGLDGWQLAVTAIESATKKKMNEKVKGILSVVGIILLLLFGIAIIFKDIIGLII